MVGGAFAEWGGGVCVLRWRWWRGLEGRRGWGGGGRNIVVVGEKWVENMRVMDTDVILEMVG